MDKARKRTHPLIGALAALYGLYLFYGIGTSMMDRYSVAKLTERMKTACVGRYLIDLPASMDFSYGHVFVKGFWITTREENQQEFETRLRARQADIEAEPGWAGRNNLEKVEDYRNNGFEGKIFRFGRSHSKGEEGGRPVDWVNVKLEAHLHNRGFSFDVSTPDGYDAEKTANLPLLLAKLRRVPDKQIPAGAGFCFGPGMFVDPLPAEDTEGVALFAGFRDHPDLALALNTRAGTEPDAEGRLARNARLDADMPLWQRPLLNKIRTGKRSINGIGGEEVLEGGRELSFVNVYLFDWEVGGTRHDVLSPFLHLEMSTGHPVQAGARPVTSFLGEEALVQLWDRISSTVRLRPTGGDALAKREPAPGPGTAPGPASVPAPGGM